MFKPFKILSFLRSQNSAYYFYWKWKNKKLPAFAGKMKFPTGDIRSHERTKKVYFNIQCKTDFPKKSFFNETVPIWKELPVKLKIGKCTYITTKKKQTILLKQICKRKKQFRLWKKMLE